MEKIAIISDIHANITALKAVLNDIKERKIKHIYCLGDLVIKGTNPDIVIDMIKENCEVVLKGNCDEIACSDRGIERKFWTTEKIGKERIKYLKNLPVMHEFYLSGQLVRLFHASPNSLEHIFNPMYSNTDNRYSCLELNNALEMFKNTEFIGKNDNDQTPRQKKQTMINILIHNTCNDDSCKYKLSNIHHKLTQFIHKSTNPLSLCRHVSIVYFFHYHQLLVKLWLLGL